MIKMNLYIILKVGSKFIAQFKFMTKTKFFICDDKANNKQEMMEINMLTAQLMDWIVETAVEQGPWEFTTVVGMLKANDFPPQEMYTMLKTLRPYIA